MANNHLLYFSLLSITDLDTKYDGQNWVVTHKVSGETLVTASTLELIIFKIKLLLEDAVALKVIEPATINFAIPFAIVNNSPEVANTNQFPSTSLINNEEAKAALYSNLTESTAKFLGHMYGLYHLYFNEVKKKSVTPLKFQTAYTTLIKVISELNPNALAIKNLTPQEESIFKIILPKLETV